MVAITSGHEVKKKVSVSSEVADGSPSHLQP